MNTSICHSIKRSPYEVFFGMKPIMGYQNFLVRCKFALMRNFLNMPLIKNYKEIMLILATLEPEVNENQNGDCNQVCNSHLKVNQKSPHVDFSHHK